MDQLIEINRIVNTSDSFSDFTIYSYELRKSSSLIIVGSDDLCYYHTLEIEFTNVSYLSLPTDFDDPQFRRANSLEINEISKVISIDPDETVYCVLAKTSCSNVRIPFFVVADDIAVRKDVVFYYDRENLKENERIANWVKRN